MTLRSAAARARSLAAQRRLELRDVTWLARLAIYRLSGRRLAASPELYRAGISRHAREQLPGMTTPTELAYFEWHAREVFEGKGDAVDLGCWFGSTTAALAMGLHTNPHPAAHSRRVHAYDHFQWEWWMDEYAYLARFGPYEPGDSFLREFELVVSPWRDRIEVHEGDLLGMAWREGPVELLLVDAMKSWSLAEHIVSGFYGSLAVGHGYVIHQDFAHLYTPWIHLVSYRLRDALVPVLDVIRSETVVFRTVGSLKDVAGSLAITRDSFSDSEVEEAFKHSLAITRPEKHSSIRAAKVMLSIYDADLEAAEHSLRQLEQAGELNQLDRSRLLQALREARAS